MKDNVAFKKAAYSLYNRAFFFNVVHLIVIVQMCMPPSRDRLVLFLSFSTWLDIASLVARVLRTDLPFHKYKAHNTI